MSQIAIKEYYSEYHGHSLSDLLRVRKLLLPRTDSFIYLAGDSSLDNKHWLFNDYNNKKQELTQQPKRKKYMDPAVNGYQTVLSPPFMVKDVNYWLNYYASHHQEQNYTSIMSAVEESTLEDRKTDLLPQDKFIVDNITNNDTLVVSVGGNDIALKPNLNTIVSLKLLINSPDWLIKNGYAPGFQHFMSIFHNAIEDYVLKLCSKNTPKKVIICMIYYLDKTPGGSWADTVLQHLGYDENPEKLQLIIDTIFQKLQETGYNIPNTNVTILPLSQVLDGNDTNDYVQRVEPSVEGGRKMAEKIFDIIKQPIL